MTYKVISHFVDLQDERHRYNPGDIFPRDGLKVSRERLIELSGSNNKLGKPVIALEQDNSHYFSDEPKKTKPDDSKEDDFSRYMNPPVEPEVKPDKEPVRVEEKPRRGRRKKTDAVK